ncbi:MAG: VCBS repeat-containing protein [Deltaproteobacteria bacterium]|nr:VCBS repeat-containing protein [Deltaproteobacteria bacterium]
MRTAHRPLRFGDLDGDGFDDLGVARPSNITVHLNTRTPELFMAHTRVVLDPTMSIDGVRTIDLNADGRPDVLGLGLGVLVCIRAGAFGPLLSFSPTLNRRPQRFPTCSDCRAGLVVGGTRDPTTRAVQTLRNTGGGMLAAPAKPIPVLHTAKSSSRPTSMVTEAGRARSRHDLHQSAGRCLAARRSRNRRARAGDDAVVRTGFAVSQRPTSMGTGTETSSSTASMPAGRRGRRSSSEPAVVLLCRG